MPILKYEAHAFNNRLGINGSHQLRVTWEEIVHAAITVGRSESDQRVTGHPQKTDGIQPG